MVDGSLRGGLEGVIITDDLERRPSRAPDHEAENRALSSIAEAMRSSPETVLQRLVEVAMDVTRSDSAGISMVEPGGEQGRFRWVATAGAWSPYRDGVMPREESPCGEVIARETVLLVKNPERVFPALLQADPSIGEALLAPFRIGGEPVGTMWTIKHDADGRFEAEDARLIKSLAGFASAANQMVQALEAAQTGRRESEARYRALFETMGQGYALAELVRDASGMAVDQRYIEFNPAIERLLGVRASEAEGRLASEVFPAIEPWWTETFAKVVREGRAETIEHFFAPLNRWFEVHAYPAGEDRFVTLYDDITKRKGAEIALREGEARFRALATVGSSSVYRMSADWREMRQLDGAAFLPHTQEATTDWVDTYIPVDERPRVREAIERAISSKDVFELEHRVLRADGTVGWTSSRAIPLFGRSGEISEWFGAATDVTARVKADRTFARLFQASPAPFLVLKPDAPHFTITDVNDAYLSATMRTRDEVLGRGIFEAYPENPSDRSGEGVSALRASLERVLASRQPDTLPGLKYDVARPDGTFEERWWSPVNSAVVDDDGKVDALIHNANDVTEERRAADSLREREELQAFLLHFSDALRAETDANAVVHLALTMLAEKLKLDRCYATALYPDEDRTDVIDEVRRPGLTPMPSRLRNSDVSKAEKRTFDGTLIFDDTANDPELNETDKRSLAAMSFGALISSPMRRGQRTPIWSLGAVSAQARHWTAAEIKLLEEVAERTWAAAERARAEAALRETEERFRTVTEAIEDVFYMTDLDRGQLLYLSPSFEVVWGMPRSALLSDLARFADTILLEDREIVTAALAIQQEGKAASSEYRIVRPDGAIRWIHDRCFPVPGDGRRRSAGVASDITARKEADEARRESEARLTAAFESVPLGVAVIDQSGTTLVANAEFRRFLPTDIMPSLDTQRGVRWRAWDEQDRLLPYEGFPGARALRGERIVPGQEMLYTDEEGRDIWTSVAAAPIRDGNAQVSGFVCVISDIDALKRSTKALRESEGRFRQFSDESTNILWIRNAETLRMEFASPAFDTIYGMPAPERGGNPGLLSWMRLIEPESRKTVLANFRRVRAGKRIELEFRVRRASDGALRWIHNTDFPLRDSTGQVRWIAGIGADITDAKEAVDRQGLLVAELQHRTRNLIAVVRSLSDRTLGNAASLEDFGDRFRPRLSALSRVQGLLSNLAAGERVTFKELLCAELAAHGATDGLASKLTLDGPADVTLRSATVQTFALALHELATNAVKYGALSAPEGHLSVTWRIESSSGAEARLHVEWRETGVVMPTAATPEPSGGYGRELIQRALPYQLKAKTRYELCSDGVRCSISVPISTA